MPKRASPYPNSNLNAMHYHLRGNKKGEKPTGGFSPNTYNDVSDDAH